MFFMVLINCFMVCGFMVCDFMHMARIWTGRQVEIGLEPRMSIVGLGRRAVSYLISCTHKRRKERVISI